MKIIVRFTHLSRGGHTLMPIRYLYSYGSGVVVLIRFIYTQQAVKIRGCANFIKFRSIQLQIHNFAMIIYQGFVD